MSAAQQAELIEKQKSLQEQEDKIRRLKHSLGNMQGQQMALEKQKKRCQITQTALTPLKEDHPVYKSIGRMFVRRTVPALMEEQKSQEQTSVTESSRLSVEIERISGVLQDEDRQFNQGRQELIALLEAFQQANAANAQLR